MLAAQKRVARVIRAGDAIITGERDADARALRASAAFAVVTVFAASVVPGAPPAFFFVGMLRAPPQLLQQLYYTRVGSRLHLTPKLTVEACDARRDKPRKRWRGCLCTAEIPITSPREFAHPVKKPRQVIDASFFKASG